MEKSKLQRMEYKTLLDLARAKNISVLEAKGLDIRKGIRFEKDGREWIALDSDLKITEKTRALGFLLNGDPRYSRAREERMGESGDSAMMPVLTLCC